MKRAIILIDYDAKSVGGTSGYIVGFVKFIYAKAVFLAS